MSGRESHREVKASKATKERSTKVEGQKTREKLGKDDDAKAAQEIVTTAEIEIKVETTREQVKQDNSVHDGVSSQQDASTGGEEAKMKAIDEELQQLRKRRGERLRQEEELKRRREERLRAEEELQRRRQQRLREEEELNKQREERLRLEKEALDIRRQLDTQQRLGNTSVAKSSDCEGKLRLLEEPGKCIPAEILMKREVVVRDKEREMQRKPDDTKVNIYREQIAIFKVLAVLSRLARAMPEDFDKLKAMYDRVVPAELKHTGKRQSELTKEATRVLQHASLYVAQIRKQRQEWEDWNDAKRRKLEGKRLMQQSASGKIGLASMMSLEASVRDAEVAASQAMTCCFLLPTLANASQGEQLQACSAADQAATAAMVACSRGMSSVWEQKVLCSQPSEQQAIDSLQLRLEAARSKATEALEVSQRQRDARMS